ncbi:hypothetical protein E2C01_075129 [Portunus trituberculatus]|uniref:Uncharacterized protein n=1 Tax=Portunus trituberculatus TaxID=210409 RepID=A0A5B7IFD1_PORTR|nr:hypothetical protein [Portunus trituberculatus]
MVVRGASDPPSLPAPALLLPSLSPGTHHGHQVMSASSPAIMCDPWDIAVSGGGGTLTRVL